MKGLLFTYFLTYGGAATAMFNPFIGLLIYVCFAIVRPEAMWYWSVPAGNYSRIVALALLLGWALNGFGTWRFGRARGLVLAFVGFWLWCLASACQAENAAIAFGFVESLAKVLLPFLVGITVIDSLPKLRALAWVIVLSQGYVALEMNLAYYSGFNRVQLDGFGGMDNNCVAIAMVTGVGLAVFLGLAALRWWQKATAFLAAMLMAHTIMLAFSRGGLLALVITAVVAFLLLPKRPVHYMAFALLVALGFRLAGTEVRERFDTSFQAAEKLDESAQSRLQLWKDCWDVMLKRPVFGLGPNHWPRIAHTYGWPPEKHAHSLWMQLGAELGFVGLGLLLTFYGLSLVRARALLRSSHDPWLQAIARMVIASIVGFMVAAQFVSLMGLELPYYVVLVGAGALKLATTPQECTVAAEANGVGPILQPRCLTY